MESEIWRLKPINIFPEICIITAIESFYSYTNLSNTTSMIFQEGIGQKAFYREIGEFYRERGDQFRSDLFDASLKYFL